MIKRFSSSMLKWIGPFALAALLAVAVEKEGAVAAATPQAAAAVSSEASVNRMLVVRGQAKDAQADLFADFCDPVVEKSGRSERTCRNVPRVSRLFVGYGLYGAKDGVESFWKSIRWRLWIDGRLIRLASFGHSDRSASRGVPRRITYVREWNVTLFNAPPGQHTVRYRTEGGSRTDTTWRFTVTRSSLLS